MASRLIRTALRTTLSQIRYVTPVHPRQARGRVAEVYRQVEADFGMLAPPIGLHSPAPDILAASWAMLRETLVADTAVSRAAKEAVAATVSLANTCPYCVEVHSATLAGLGARADAGAIGAGQLEAVADPGIRTIATWAHAGGRWPFPAQHAAELIGVAVTFEYLNRMVNVFLGESPLPPRVPVSARAGAHRVLGQIMRGPAVRGGRPGDSLRLLEAAPPARDLAWAAPNPVIADAFTRATATVDAAAARSVPLPVRVLVSAELAGWDGRPSGVFRAWADQAVRKLPDTVRGAGRLALLVAKASYQVDQEVIDGFRREQSGDRALLELTSWASLTAARRAGDLLWQRRDAAA